MDQAFDVLSKLADNGRINQSQYLEGLDAIKKNLDISEQEYMDALDRKWLNEEIHIN